MVKKIQWKGENLILVKKYFASKGNMTVLLIDETKYPHYEISLNSPSVILGPTEILVNDFGKNKGIKNVLIQANYLKSTGKWAEFKNELCEICEIL